MLRPSDMKVILSKVVFDESDDDELEFNSEGNRKELLKLSNKLKEKCNKLGLEIELFRNGIGFRYDYANNKKNVNIDNFDDNIRELENQIGKKSNYRLSIFDDSISFSFVTGENISLAQKVLFDDNQITTMAEAYLETDNFKIFKNAYKKDDELLNDFNNIIKFILKHV